MTYTYNDQAIFEAVPGAKAIIRRPIGMPGFRWKTYAAGVVLALNSKGSTSALELGEAIHKAMLDDAQESPSMKLVDILARELKAWPEGCKVITQGSDGYVVSAKDIDVDSLHFDHNAWSGEGGSYMEIHELASDHRTSIVTRAEWQAAVDALNAPKVDIADGNVRLGALIEMGYLKPVHLETPSYDFSARPADVLPMKYPQFVGRIKRHQPVEPKPKSTAQENTEFLEARVKLLEAELAERRKEAKASISAIIDDETLDVMGRGFSVRLSVEGRHLVLIRDKS